MPNIFDTINAQQMAKILTNQLPPPRTCEACGKLVPVGDTAINIWIISHFAVGSPGHPGIPAVQTSESWSCSPECWRILALQHMENMKAMLDAIHERLANGPLGEMP